MKCFIDACRVKWRDSVSHGPTIKSVQSEDNLLPPKGIISPTLLLVIFFSCCSYFLFCSIFSHNKYQKNVYYFFSNLAAGCSPKKCGDCPKKMFQCPTPGLVTRRPQPLRLVRLCQYVERMRLVVVSGMLR